MSEFIIMACINCVFEVALHSVYIYKCCGCVGYWFVYEACRKVAGCIVIDVTSNVSNIYQKRSVQVYNRHWFCSLVSLNHNAENMVA